MGYRDESVAFRFLSLLPAQLEEVRSVRPDALSRPTRGEVGRVTGVFDIDESSDVDWIKAFIEKHELAPADYGLFVSIATSSDSEIVQVPQFATDLFRTVGGVLDFSFTVLSEDADPSIDDPAKS